MNILYYDWNSQANMDILEAFNRLGIQYQVFKYSCENYEVDEAFSEYLKTVIERNQFDCIFSFDYFPVISYTAMECGIYYYAWIYDCPHNTLFSESIYNMCNKIFFFDREQCYYFQARGVKNAFHMPLAVNGQKYNRLLGTDITHTQYLHDISFIGSLYNENMFNQIQYLPEYLNGYLAAVLQSQKKIYGYDLIAELLTEKIVRELDRYIVVGDDVAISIPHKQIYSDILYKKLTELERKEVLEICAECSQVTLYTGSRYDGMNNNIKVLSPVGYDTEVPIVYHKSKINLNITCRSIVSGMPLRVLDIMAAGGFLLSNYQQELAEYFVPGQDLVLYESMEDLREKVSYYLTHDEERIQIAQNGCKKVQEQFSYDCMLKKIFDLGGLID